LASIISSEVSFTQPSSSDEQLVRESQAGSLDAFEELVSRYEHRVYGFILRTCRNPDDAAEITQDTFVKAYQALAQFDPGKPFAPWLFTIARRKCVDRHRATPPQEPAPVPDRTDLDDPAQVLARKEESDALWECAHRVLPETQFQALWLRYREDMSVQRIAHVLRKTKTHVKVLLFRARRRLTAELEALSSGTLPQPSASAKQAMGQKRSAGRAPASTGAENWTPSVRTL
jgi:RNA polymerase sigma-70 factor (ECF subfamily)